MLLPITQTLKQLDSSLGATLESVAQKLLPLLLGAAAVLFIGYHIAAITYRYPLDYGEAPLLDQAMRLANGQGIYRSDLSGPPYTISNYPPLYVITLIPFLELFGPGYRHILPAYPTLESQCGRLRHSLLVCDGEPHRIPAGCPE